MESNENILEEVYERNNWYGASITDEFRIAIEAMDDLERMSKWYDVNEKKPLKQGHYLVIAPKSFPKNCKVVVAEFYEDNGIFYSESSDSPMEDVTHWQHLPIMP